MGSACCARHPDTRRVGGNRGTAHWLTCGGRQLSARPVAIEINKFVNLNKPMPVALFRISRKQNTGCSSIAIRRSVATAQANCR